MRKLGLLLALAALAACSDKLPTAPGAATKDTVTAIHFKAACPSAQADSLARLDGISRGWVGYGYTVDTFTSGMHLMNDGDSLVVPVMPGTHRVGYTVYLSIGASSTYPDTLTVNGPTSYTMSCLYAY